jgi:hypothetical protein
MDKVFFSKGSSDKDELKLFEMYKDLFTQTFIVISLNSIKYDAELRDAMFFVARHYGVENELWRSIEHGTPYFVCHKRISGHTPTSLFQFLRTLSKDAPKRRGDTVVRCDGKSALLVASGLNLSHTKPGKSRLHVTYKGRCKVSSFHISMLEHKFGFFPEMSSLEDRVLKQGTKS